MDEISFTGGFVYDSAIYYVTAVVDLLEEQDIHHALMLRRHGGTWAHWPIEARIVSHCVCPGPMIFSLSEEGRIEVAHGPSRRWESLASLRTQPGLGNLTAVRQVGEFVYVVGMQRQVYRRPVNARRWTRVDGGIVVPSGSLEIAGLRALDGFSETDLYAAGFYGEIWHFDGQQWAKLDSPTNAKLESVCCVKPDTVYISGARGLVLKGNKSGWTTISDDAMRSTLWSIVHFRERIYLSSSQGMLFTLEDDEIVPIDHRLGKRTTFTLHAGKDVLLSIGAKDLMTFDGNQWRALAYP